MGLQIPELQLKFCESPLWFSGDLWPHPPLQDCLLRFSGLTSEVKELLLGFAYNNSGSS